MSPFRARPYLLSSAALWLLAGICLALALYTRSHGGGPTGFASWGRRHDAAAAIASLLLAAAAWSLREVPATRSDRFGHATAWLGVVSGVATALLLVLVFLTGASDMFYMLPQGGLGLWALVLSARKPLGFSAPLQLLGVIAGVGLVLIAISFVMIASALGPALVTLVDARSVAVSQGDIASPLNSWGHQLLNIGTLLGLPFLPIWAGLAARALRPTTVAP